jgi:biopolymer transport protein ExbD
MEEKSFDYMNVIPLVDVMLVLLTIVLTTSSFVVSGAIPVALPKASSVQSEAARGHTVLVDARGVVYFDSQPIALAQLKERLSGVDVTTPINVRADKSVTVQSCVDVLDIVSAKGFKKVSLQTERREGTPGGR